MSRAARQNALIVGGASVVTLAFLFYGLSRGLVPAIVTVFSVAALTFPGLGFVALACLVPFDAYIPGVTIYKDLLWTDLLMAAVIVAALRHRGAPRAQPLEHQVAAVALVALAVWQAISLTLASDWPDALDNLLRFGSFALLIVVCPPILTPATVRAACTALMVGTLGRIAYEAVPYFSSETFVLHPSYQFGGWTSNPNTLAGLASPVLSVSLGLCLYARSRLRQVLCGAIACAIAAALVLSFSKGSWLAAAVGVLVWAAVAHRALWRREVITAAVVACALLSLVGPVRRAPSLMAERWASPASSISNLERARYLNVGAQVVLASPVFGVGLENFPREFRRVTGDLSGPDDPHNAYLHIAAELGLPALAAFLLFLAATCAAIVRSGSAAATTGLAGAFASMLVFQLFSAEPWNSRVFWLLMTLPWPLAMSARVQPAAP